MPDEKSAKLRAQVEAAEEIWGPLRDAIFANPQGQHICPFCNSPTIHAAWGLYIEKPRAASFDVWCERCGKRDHCAILLPAHAPDSFPPGAAHPVASLTKRVFDRGKKLKWW